MRQRNPAKLQAKLVRLERKRELLELKLQLLDLRIQRDDERFLAKLNRTVEFVTVTIAGVLQRQHRRRTVGDPVHKAARPRCGACTRAGHPCQAPAVWDERRNRPVNGRCRLHGGRSTGPRTPEGRAKIAAAARVMMLARHAARRAAGP